MANKKGNMMTNKEWWRKNVVWRLPDDTIEWESLGLWERYWTIPRLRKHIEKNKETA